MVRIHIYPPQTLWQGIITVLGHTVSVMLFTDRNLRQAALAVRQDRRKALQRWPLAWFGDAAGVSGWASGEAVCGLLCGSAAHEGEGKGGGSRVRPVPLFSAELGWIAGPPGGATSPHFLT